MGERLYLERDFFLRLWTTAQLRTNTTSDSRIMVTAPVDDTIIIKCHFSNPSLFRAAKGRERAV
jgi:hypothetical protein